MRLSNLKILSKILLVIGLLSAVAAVLTYNAVTAMSDMDKASYKMDAQATNSRLIASLGANLLAISREDFRMGTDPRPGTITEVTATIQQERKVFVDRMGRIRSNNAEAIETELNQIEVLWKDFQAEVDEDIEMISSIGENRTPEQTLLIQNSLGDTLAASQKLRRAFQDLAKKLEDNVGTLREEASQTYKQSEGLMYTMAVLGIVGGITIGFLIARFGIVKPIRELAGSVQELAAGKFDIEVAGRGRKDEIGEIADAVEDFKVKLAEEARREVEEKTEADRIAAEQRKAEMIKLADDFENAVGEIVNVVSSASTELQAAANTLTSSAEETSSQSASVASAAEQAAMNVQTVASAIEELASSASEIGRQAEQSKTVATRAVDQANRTNAQMRELRENADQIGAIISLIDEIAEKTNLLALNATIEAARAGEAGKGFAVVAQEVKGLAEQTAKATSEISTQIKSMQGSTTDAGEAIASIGKTIDDMNTISDSIFGAIGEQSGTTAEVARNVQQTAQGTQEVTDNITGVTQAAQEASSASAQVLASANELAQQSNALRTQMTRFLETVRAA
ncbi:methyl-accepting chemotaxis protein [Stappia sp.]|uniref:methyl-accepting chemotaxis protein n=1 Tax=Stappia sp. TaxID=1870903 RepID=UPI003A9A50F0